MFTRHLRSLPILLVALLSGACTTWKTVPVSPATFFSEDTPDMVRVYRQQGPRLQLREPRLAGNYVEGEVYGERGTVQRVRLDDVTAVEVRLASGGRAFAAFTLLASVITLVAVSQAY